MRTSTGCYKHIVDGLVAKKTCGYILYQSSATHGDGDDDGEGKDNAEKASDTKQL